MNESIKSHAGALKDSHGVTAYPLKASVGFSGKFYVKKPVARSPSWLTFVTTGTRSSLVGYTNSNTSGVLLLSAEGRLFALTFGHGRYLLQPGCWETDFGLRVALNTIDADRLRSLDVRTFEDMTVYTRRQTSRASSLDAFGVDVSRDLLRAVTGEPSDLSYGLRLSGADALAVNIQIKFGGLEELCGKLLKARNLTRYKDRFGWIDHLSSIRDPLRINALEGELIKALRMRSTSKMHLAAPEIVDWASVSRFTYSTNPEQEHVDLDIDDYLDTVGTKLSKLKTDDLLKHRINVLTATDDTLDRWSVHDCLVSEIRRGQSVYVLTGGQWFEVEPKFSRRVNRYVKALDQPSLKLPPAMPGESEGAYNMRAARSWTKWALLDLQLVRCEAFATPIEVCDLLSKDGHFVHVKKKTRSATLSHLFAQGTVSAEAFLREEEFREGIRSLLGVVRPSLVPVIPKTRPKTSSYQIVYAIIADPSRDLPFFSRLHLMQASQRLTDLGYRVGLVRISES